MLTGRLGDTTGRPYIEGRVILPRLNITGDVSFLVDTGADTSMLMPGDCQRVGIPYDQLQGDSEVGGVGGPVHCFVERAIIVFTEHTVAAYAYAIDLDIMPPDPSNMDCPSLLGRDVLARWVLIYDAQNARSERRLRAEVKQADATLDLRPT